MEGLNVVETSLTVSVHPSNNNKIFNAVLRNLSSMLFQYNETFEGIVIAYDVTSMDNYAKVLPGIFPYVAVKLTSPLLLFSPKPDMLIEGKVVKVTPESIHVIVLGFASAIIVRQDIREEFSYKTSSQKKGEGCFVNRSDKKHFIMDGSAICFQVKSFDEEVLHICGSLKETHTGSSRFLAGKSEDKTHTHSKRKKRKNMSEVGLHDNAIEKNGHVEKKSKKHKISQDR